MAKIDLNDYLEKLTEPEDRETVANRAYQRELFEQYVTKDGNFPEQRAQLLEDFRVGKELTGPKGLRRKLGAFDLISIHALREEGDSKNRDKISIFKQIIQHSARI